MLISPSAKKALTVILLLALAASSLMSVEAAAAQATLRVCYITGLENLPQGITVRTEVYDGAGRLFFERTFRTESDNANGILPIMAPIDGYELVYFNGVLVAGFIVSDWILPPDNCVGGRINDGRINDGNDHMAAPAVVYCLDGGGIQVFDVDLETSNGNLAFEVSGAEIANALISAASSGSSVQIRSGLDDSLWASPDNQLVLMGPDMREPEKTYTFAFSGSTC